MTTQDWIAVLSIAFPLFGKVAVDVVAYLNARKHTALANLVGMAGRQAATAARELATLPPGADGKALERSLIQASAQTMLSEMSGSAKLVKADDGKLANLVQGELDKLKLPAAVIAAPAPAPV